MGEMNKKAVTSLLLAMVSCMAVMMTVYQREGGYTEVSDVIADYNNNAALKVFYAYSDDKVTWDQARGLCAQRGMKLATMDSRAKLNAVRAVSKNANVWVGFRSPNGLQNQKDAWVWESNAPAQGGANDFWAPNEPNKDNRWPNEFCAELVPNGKLNNLKCNDRRWLRGYVCDTHPKVPSTVRLTIGRDLTWDEANLECRKRYNTGLGTLKNGAEQMESHVSGNNVWTGLRIEPGSKWTKTGFKWLSQKPVGQLVWGPGEPNNANEQCAHLRADGKYNDLPCHARLRYFICDRQWSVVPRFQVYDQMAQFRPVRSLRVPHKYINAASLRRFRLGFEVRLPGEMASWASLFHVGASDADRRPAVLVRKRKMLVHFQSLPHGYDGCIPNRDIGTAFTRIRIDALTDRLQVRYNEQLVCNVAGSFQARNGNIPIFLSSPWYIQANAYLRRFGIKYF